MSLRVLVLSFYYPPDLCAGSFRCSAFISELQEKLGETGQIDLITTLPNRYVSYEIQAENLEQKTGLVIHRISLPTHRSGMLDQAKAYIHFAKSAIKLAKNNQYDLVFATSSRLMTASLGAWISRKVKAPLYLDIRDLFVDTITDILPKKVSILVKPFLSGLEYWTFNQAKRINLISKGFETYFTSRYPNLEPSWFSNGVDSEFISAFPSVNTINNTSSPLTILYAGNIGEGQGLHTIIPFLSKRLNGKICFKIIGDGGRKTQLIRLLAEQNCEDVQMISPINRKELINAYQEADILFLHLNDYPAFRRVLPSKLFEYAATGKPILAGLEGYAATFVKNEIENAAVFEPCDVEGAMQAFASLSLNHCDRQQFIDKYARKTIMQAMTTDVCSLVEAHYS